MGGSGGGYHYFSERDYKKEINEIREQSRDETFETDVSEMISQKLGLANSRDAEQIRLHLEIIKEAVDEDIEGSVELQFGGSVSKHTYVEGLSDVDVLLKINKSELSEQNPREVLEYVKSKLESKLTNVNEIKIGTLAVTVEFNDGTEIQLLPSIKTSSGFKIPSRNGKKWSNVIRPDRFASKLTEVNQECGGKVVPTIKIVKTLNSKLPPDQQLSGYHIESLSIEIFKSTPDDLKKTPKSMVKYFYEKAGEKVKTPVKDGTNQSIHVDDYLGDENSHQRLRMSYILNRTYKRMATADELKSVEEWENILGGE